MFNICVFYCSDNSSLYGPKIVKCCNKRSLFSWIFLKKSLEFVIFSLVARHYWSLNTVASTILDCFFQTAVQFLLCFALQFPVHKFWHSFLLNQMGECNWLCPVQSSCNNELVNTRISNINWANSTAVFLICVTYVSKMYSVSLPWAANWVHSCIRSIRINGRYTCVEKWRTTKLFWHCLWHIWWQLSNIFPSSIFLHIVPAFDIFCQQHMRSTELFLSTFHDGFVFELHLGASFSISKPTNSCRILKCVQQRAQILLNDFVEIWLGGLKFISCSGIKTLSITIWGSCS